MTASANQALVRVAATSLLEAAAVAAPSQTKRSDGANYARAWEGLKQCAASQDDGPAAARQLRAFLRATYIAMPAEKCSALLTINNTMNPVNAYEAVLGAEVTYVFQAQELPLAAPGIAVWQGDMSKLAADAVVNPCNNALLGCFLPEHKCLDNILHGAAGPRLRVACMNLLEGLGLEEDANGNCRVTPAFCLPAKHVFHTVGPCLLPPGRRNQPPRAPTAQDRAELRSCYTTCLQTACDMGLQSIAFCCISTGIFGYPAEEAAAIAVDEVMRLRGVRGDGNVPLVIFNVFKDEDLAIYTKLLN